MGEDALAQGRGEEAVKLLSKSAAEVSLVVLDLGMPSISADEAIRRMRLIRENIQVLISSGYPESEALSRVREKGAAGFLQKPYKAADLIRRIEQILNDRSTGPRP